MPVQMSIPFRLAENGTVSVATDQDVQIDERVGALVSTEPGSRVMMPAFGVPLQKFVFEYDDEVTGQDISAHIADALAVYEPGVSLNAAHTTVGNDGKLSVEVDYSRREDASTSASLAASSNDVYISPGGTVSEVVRG